jgi:5'-nucleotidase
MEGAAQYAKRFCRQLLRMTAPEGQAILLNVNFPSVPPKGIRATRLGFRLYSDEVEVRDDPRGRHYLWIGGPGGAKNEPVEGADTEALDEGLISVTPLSIEATQPDHLGVAAYVAGPTEER